MSNFTSSQRDDQYQKLKNFTQEIHREIIETTSALGWTTESIEIDNDNQLVCPYDSSHRIGRTILDQHLESCQWKQEGYSKLDVPLPESVLSPNSYSSVKLDCVLQSSVLKSAKKKDPTMEIESYECSTWHKLYFLSKHEFLTLMIGSDERLIPRTSDRIFADFTRDERKVLYDYVVSNTMKTDIGHDITDTQDLKSEGQEDKKLSFLEMLIQERNLKRRRAKHRGVHTNKKSHTEILREVIQQQMKLYEDYTKETQEIDNSMETTPVMEKQYSGKNADRVQDSPTRFNESSLKRRYMIADGSRNSHESTSFRNDQKYKILDKSYRPYEMNSGREKCARIIDAPRETHKRHKHKRSRSREREHGRKSGRHDFTRTRHKRKDCRTERRREIVD